MDQAEYEALRVKLADQILYDDERGLKFKRTEPIDSPEPLATKAPSRPKIRDGRCLVPTSKGNRCPTPPEPGRSTCHVHDPNGKFALQRPKYRERLIAQLREMGLPA